MNHSEIQNSEERGHPRDSLPRSVLQRSLLGEYLSWALMLHAALGCAVWLVLAVFAPQNLVFAITGIWVVLRAAGVFAQRRFTPLVTAGCIAGAWAAWQSLFGQSVSEIAIYLRPLFMVMLGVVLLMDLIEVATAPGLAPWARRIQKWNWHWGIIVICLMVFLVYLVVMPTIGWIINGIDPPESGVLEELSFGEQVRLRCMKAVVTLMFFTLGATVGSFLNVVAYRMPRGESVVFRSSRCPACGARISARDNIPILGWLLLRGRCRACQIAISPRYPTVEAITALMFLALYFTELISGGANIPLRQPNTYHGIVWIIFYTKWDLVALYFFHCFALSVLLAWTLIDIDRKRIPLLSSVGVGVLLLVLPMLYPDLLPVLWLRGLVGQWETADWFSVMVTSALGGASGAFLGWLTAQAIRLPKRTGEGVAADASEATLFSCTNLVSTGMVVGLSLGWQAAVAIWMVTLALRPLVLGIARHRNWREPPLTAIVLLVYLAQLLGWRWLTVGWWPSYRAAPLVWVVVAGAMVLLWAMNRFLSDVRPSDPFASRQQTDLIATSEVRSEV